MISTTAPATTTPPPGDVTWNGQTAPANSILGVLLAGVSALTSTSTPASAKDTLALALLSNIVEMLTAINTTVNSTADSTQLITAVNHINTNLTQLNETMSRIDATLTQLSTTTSHIDQSVKVLSDLGSGAGIHWVRPAEWAGGHVSLSAAVSQGSDPTVSAITLTNTG